MCVFFSELPTSRYFCVPLVLLILSCIISIGFCTEFTIDSVPLGFKLSALDKQWVSGNGAFAFGFLEIDVDEYVVGIKYNLGTKDANLPVWTVGGGIRVSVNSTFMLAIDGNLLLVNNPSGIILWSSNSSNLGVQKASLLNNGNLVLLGSKDDEILWESFSFPTNTLLPSQSLHYPQYLRALSTRSTFSYYSLLISRFGELSLVWERNVTYWSSPQFSDGPKEAKFDSEGIFGIYDDAKNAVWSVSDNGGSSVNLRHLRIDQDGNVRIYLWDNSTWKIGWQAIRDQCNVFGSCGLYSICGYNSSGPVCNCLYTDGSDSGCKRMPDLENCNMRTSIMIMKQTVLYGLYPSKDDKLFLSDIACKEYCSNDTSCIAATSMNDGSGLCTIKRTGFVSGYNSPYTPAISFLKVCSIPQAATTPYGNGVGISESTGLIAGNGSHTKLFLAIALVVILTVLIILSFQILAFLLLYHRRKIKVRTRIPFGKDAQMNSHYSVLIRLSFEEIKELTNNFSNPLGTSAYKGMLRNKTPIVAKVLKNVVVLEKEFRVAISTLSGVHHRNLTILKGFCFESTNKVILYEYVPNGSLDNWLFNCKDDDQNVRFWQQKVDIALGIARALAYLHSECHRCITHGNLKLENVLLDENLVPKVTDFGLENFFVKQEVPSDESPSERDIYLLGHMFLQIVTQKREVLLRENMEQILDEIRKFVSGDSLEGIERLVRISFWCMQDRPFLRPSIGEVVKVLQGTLSVDRPPLALAVRQESMTDDVAEIVEEEC